MGVCKVKKFFLARGAVAVKGGKREKDFDFRRPQELSLLMACMSTKENEG